MRRVLMALAAVGVALGIFGCTPRPNPDPEEYTARLQAALAGVPGVAGVNATLSLQGPTATPNVRCDLTSVTTSRDELLEILDRALQTVANVVREVGDTGVVNCTIADPDRRVVLTPRDLGTRSHSVTFRELFERYPA